ncbi:MAG: DUF3667 domain-containing protein [Leeuwenhoekiella sp.]
MGVFCHQCGQRNKGDELTFKDITQDLTQSLFSVEAPLWLTLSLLFTKPHILFKDYMSGKRKRYYRPVAFFILTTAFYLLVRAVLGFTPEMDTSVRAT